MSYLTHFWTSKNPEPAAIVWTEKDSEADGYLVVGGWCVPLMWSLCFSAGDVSVLLKPKEDWSDPEEPGYGASCDTTIELAIQNIERRMESLLKIMPVQTHDACTQFLNRLRTSNETYVHMDVSLLLENEDDPSDGKWKTYFSELLAGLDVPVSKVRKGIAGTLFGTGLPVGWKYLCAWAISNGSIRSIFSPSLPLYQAVGATSLTELQSWQA